MLSQLSVGADEDAFAASPDLAYCLRLRQHHLNPVPLRPKYLLVAAPFLQEVSPIN